MDLGAYAQIEDLNYLLEANNIDIPRLRGIRWMKEEDPYNIKETIKNSLDDIEVYECEKLVTAEPVWTFSNMHSYSSWTDYLCDYYIAKESEGSKCVRWDRIHGEKRKTLKFAIKKQIKRFKATAETFNKYVGREDILCIHARIGGGNWPYYHQYVDHQPWFIEKVDDYFDSTYCDIYVKINPDIIKR